MTILFDIIIAVLAFAGTLFYRGTGLLQVLSIVCLFVQVFLIVLQVMKEEGVKKIIPVAVGIVAWFIAFLIFPNRTKEISLVKDVLGFFWTGIKWAIGIPIALFIMKIFFGGGQTSSSSSRIEEDSSSSEPAFGEWMPGELIDENNNYWVKDYAGSNIARYHCNSTGESVELYEGSTQYYGGNEIQGSDGRTYHFH